MVRLLVRANTYYDSVTLMLISKELKNLPGVSEALVGMGTELNLEIAANIGLGSLEFEKLTANDFFVAALCEGEADWLVLLDTVEELLNAKKQSGSMMYKPATLASALKMEPSINMALISVPGRYAADVARDCLEKDIHVMMFSDNVSLDDELQLKEYAVKKGLLMMGPDCGTAIINHVPLGFANVVRPGNIGIIGASGTGTQEVASLIDQLGGGVSQVIGTGGRDLSQEIGGLCFSLALDALIDDTSTKVLVLISKPPSLEVREKILAQAKAGGKPVVVCFIGGGGDALSLEDAAHKAVALSRGEEAKTFEGFTAQPAIPKIDAQQQYIRGLYTGGTLCEEAMHLLSDSGEGHSFLDFGDDSFTVGRPHPMIDPSLRNERLIEEANKPSTAVILLDCVIGHGAHEDAAGELALAIKQAKAGSKAIFVASVCGTEGDPQGLQKSRAALEDAGAIVFPSNAQAARFAGLIIKGRGHE